MSWFRSLLELVLGPVDHLLQALPLASARWFALALLVVPVLVVALSPRASALRGAPGSSSASGGPWYRDLRLWATLISLPYILVYLLA